MKKILVIFVLMMSILISGCVTSATIDAFDKDGKLVSRTVTTSDIVQKITESTKDKTLIVWESGWLAYVSISPGTTDDPTPHGKIWGGKLDKGYISIHKDHMIKDINWNGIAEVIAATNKSLSISASGIGESTIKPGDSNAPNTK